MSIWMLRSSSPVLDSPRMTRAWPARLAAIRFSPPEQGNSPVLRAAIAEDQSMPAFVMMLPGPEWMNRVKSCRPS